MHENLPTIESEDVRGLSERSAVDLMFKAHNEINKFYRDANKTKDHVHELEKWVEIYYQVNLLMFPIGKAFTPYKAKLMLLPMLLITGKIRCLFDHLTEATENSNHGVNAMYHNHSMRDGGMHWNMTSEFEDLFHSMAKCMKLKLSRLHKSGLSTKMAFLETEVPTDMSRNMYLEICRKSIPDLELIIGKTEAIFRGMRFFLCGSQFEKVTKFDSLSKVTKKALALVVSRLDGVVLCDSAFDTLANKCNLLQHCYVVLQDDSYFEMYRNQSISTQDPKIPAKFLQSTRNGSFIYVNANYIVDCYHQHVLLDPSLERYMFDVDTSHFVQSNVKPSENISRHMQGQRRHVDVTELRPVLPKTALKRSLAAARRSEVPTCDLPVPDRKSMTREETNKQRRTRIRQRKALARYRSGKGVVSREAYNLFQIDYAKKQRWVYTADNGTVDIATLSSRCGQFWKNAPPADKEEFFQKARYSLGLPTIPQVSAAVSLTLSSKFKLT